MARCPYCLKEIERDKICYYIKKRGGYEAADRKMRDFLTRSGGDASGSDPFWRFWTNYNDEKNARIASERVVKTQEEILRMKALLTRRNASDAKKQPADWQPGAAAELSLEGPAAPEGTTDCEIREKNQGLYYDFEFLENGQRLAVSRPACGSCHNVIPEEIFRMPLIKIALAGSREAGKTCLLLSWFNSLDDAYGKLNRDPNRIEFRSLQWDDAGIVDSFDTMLREFKKRICPDPTKQRFIPPSFMQVSYQTKDGKHQAILGLYDAAGEIIVSSKRGAALVEYMPHMDGIIYLVDPGETTLSVGKRDIFHKIEQGYAMLYEDAKVLDKPQQRSIQSAAVRSETLEEVIEGVISKAAERHNVRTLLDRQSIAVLNALKNYVPDDDLKEMEIALAVCKCDKLKGLQDVTQYDTGGLFFDEDKETDPDIRASMRLMRDRGLRKFFEDKVFNLERFEGTFRSCSLHMIAALGCEAKLEEVGEDESRGPEKRTVLQGDYKPIRAEEPLIDLIRRIVRNQNL